jgi:23S rRNA (guanine745-N1)-methyltransferase
VAARAVLHQHGIGVAALDAVIERACDVPFGDGGTVVDLGSGTGDLLGGLAQRRRVTGVGIDLSPHAAAHAARRFPDLTWLVANADRRLPLLEGSVALVMSLHGRRNPQECARVLDHPGTLLVAFPAADDLVELRAAIEGRGLEQDRVERAVAEHEPLFAVADRTTIRERRLLEPAVLEALLRTTYRGARRAAAARIETLTPMEVTFATEILRFTRR